MVKFQMIRTYMLHCKREKGGRLFCKREKSVEFKRGDFDLKTHSYFSQLRWNLISFRSYRQSDNASCQTACEQSRPSAIIQ
jgi:hypothetical protein